MTGAGAGPTGVHPIEHWVLHVDLDQFIAAVEVLRRPELAGLPVIVGGDGDPTKRGVVSTASYEAREYGVGSGMALRIAARKCPDAVFLPVDREAYDEASAAVMGTLRSLEWGGRPVVVEVLGWDEAFLAAGPRPGDEDPTGRAASSAAAGPGPAPRTSSTPKQHTGGGGGAGEPPTRAAGGPDPSLGKGAPGGPSRADPVAFAGHIRERVLEETRLHCSVGIGDNKLRAKIATEFGKPRGSYVLTAENWFEVMGDRPTRALWGIGSEDGEEAGRAGHRHRQPARRSRTRGCWRRSSGRRWGRGTTASAAGSATAW